MFNYAVFDTETIGLDKPFCYNIGYIIISDGEIVLKRDFVVEQIWHNLPLFSTAYFADKRPLYIDSMKKRLTKMDKFGYICQQMRRDFKAFEVQKAFAYNSPFDERVFAFNCEWFKCSNPLDNMPIGDIRAFVQKYLVGKVYKNFCEDYGFFTESGNYSTTAENVYKFVSGNLEFVEDHTALSDSLIENAILNACVECGADLTEELAAVRTIPRNVLKELWIHDRDGEDWLYPYSSIKINKARTEIFLK